MCVKRGRVALSTSVKPHIIHTHPTQTAVHTGEREREERPFKVSLKTRAERENDEGMLQGRVGLTPKTRGF